MLWKWILCIMDTNHDLSDDENKNELLHDTFKTLFY